MISVQSTNTVRHLDNVANTPQVYKDVCGTTSHAEGESRQDYLVVEASPVGPQKGKELR